LALVKNSYKKCAQKTLMKLTPSQSMSSFLGVCHASDVAVRAEVEDRVAAEEGVDAVHVEELDGQDVDEGDVDDAEDHHQEVANGGEVH